MAKKTIVHLTDDLDESKADKTVRYSLDALSYEIASRRSRTGVLRPKSA